MISVEDHQYSDLVMEIAEPSWTKIVKRAMVATKKMAMKIRQASVQNWVFELTEYAWMVMFLKHKNG